MSQIDYNKPLQYSKDSGAIDESDRIWHDVKQMLIGKDGTIAVKYGDGLITLVTDPHKSVHLRNKPETE